MINPKEELSKTNPYPTVLKLGAKRFKKLNIKKEPIKITETNQNPRAPLYSTPQENK